MAKKEPKPTQTFNAIIRKNPEQGGAWQLRIYIASAGSVEYEESTAWSNPSAAKRKAKEVLLRETPRKTIKWEVIARDSNSNKPIITEGHVTYLMEG